MKFIYLNCGMKKFVKKILAVINATYAVAKRKPEKNQFNDQLPVGLLAQLVRALHRYRRGQGSNPGKPDFFQAFFSQLHKLR